MIRYIALACLVLMFGTPAYAECALTLSYGQGNVSSIPTDHIHDALTTRYTYVESRVDGTSNVHEIGAECEVWRDFHIAVSHMGGLEASANHKLYFNGLALGTIDLPGVDLSGYSFPGINHPRIDIPPITLPNIPPSSVDVSHLSVPGFKLLDIRETGMVEAWRISFVKYFGMEYFGVENVDTYVRIGAHYPKGVHRLNVPITDDVRLSYQKRHTLDISVVPYVGAGVTYNRGKAVSFRAGAELLSLGPYNIWTWSVGIDVPLRFK